MQSCYREINPSAGKRKTWVDSVRGICMLAIVLNHTDSYLIGGAPVIEYGLFGTNAVMTFFVVSGYLFYSESGKNINVKRKLTSIVRLLVLPYFIFSFIIAIPKALVHGYSISFIGIIKDIIYGQASWFIIALVVSKFIFVFLIYFSQKYSKAILPIACIILSLIPFYINCDLMKIWNLNIGLMTIIYLYIGFLYHSMEKLFSKFLTLK
ncbi:MAG: acyltransferase, partial [Prevotella sp.]|nr:acyltransferase [Prevotella sp.]